MVPEPQGRRPVTETPSLSATSLDGPAPEQAIAHDLARRAVPLLPAAVVVGAVGWGVEGALSATYAVVLVVLNFLLSAALISWSARISLSMLMGTILVGYLLRLGLVTVAVLLVRDAAWVDLVPLGLTLIATHLGLLFWEARHVSASLAFPGLKPRPSRAPDRPRPARAPKQRKARA